MVSGPIWLSAGASELSSGIDGVSFDSSGFDTVGIELLELPLSPLLVFADASEDVWLVSLSAGGSEEVSLLSPVQANTEKSANSSARQSRVIFYANSIIKPAGRALLIFFCIRILGRCIGFQLFEQRF